MTQRIGTIKVATMPKESMIGRFFPSLGQLTRNINRVALPAIALFAMSNAQLASGGPITWFACIAVCEATAAAATAATAGAAAGALVACVSACQPLLYLPFCP